MTVIDEERDKHTGLNNFKMTGLYAGEPKVERNIIGLQLASVREPGKREKEMQNTSHRLHDAFCMNANIRIYKELIIISTKYAKDLYLA